MRLKSVDLAVSGLVNSDSLTFVTACRHTPKALCFYAHGDVGQSGGRNDTKVSKGSLGLGLEL